MKLLLLFLLAIVSLPMGITSCPNSPLDYFSGAVIDVYYPREELIELVARHGGITILPIQEYGGFVDLSFTARNIQGLPSDNSNSNNNNNGNIEGLPSNNNNNNGNENNNKKKKDTNVNGNNNGKHVYRQKSVTPHIPAYAGKIVSVDSKVDGGLVLADKVLSVIHEILHKYKIADNTLTVLQIALMTKRIILGLSAKDEELSSVVDCTVSAKEYTDPCNRAFIELYRCVKPALPLVMPGTFEERLCILLVRLITRHGSIAIGRLANQQ